jgi:acyl-CoA thioester hydrolase
MKSFVYPFRVYIEDTDCYQVVYHANYLNFYERARSEWLEQAGFGMQWQKKQNVLFAIRSFDIEYIVPAKTPDLLEVVIDGVNVGRASITISHYIRYQEKPDIMLNKGLVKICCINSDFNVSAVPKELKEELLSDS